MLVWVSTRFELAKVRVIGIWLYFRGWVFLGCDFYQSLELWWTTDTADCSMSLVPTCMIMWPGRLRAESVIDFVAAVLVGQKILRVCLSRESFVVLINFPFESMRITMSSLCEYSVVSSFISDRGSGVQALTDELLVPGSGGKRWLDHCYQLQEDGWWIIVWFIFIVSSSFHLLKRRKAVWNVRVFREGNKTIVGLMILWVVF